MARNRSDGSTGSALDGGDGVDVDSPKIPSVTSWSAFPTAGDTAGVVSVEANDKLQDITTLEARHRQNVGPEYVCFHVRPPLSTVLSPRTFPTGSGGT